MTRATLPLSRLLLSLCFHLCFDERSNRELPPSIGLQWLRMSSWPERGREGKTREVLTATLIAVSGFQASLVKPPRWTVWLTYRDWSPWVWYLVEEGDVKTWAYCERWKSRRSPWSIMDQRERQGRKGETKDEKCANVSETLTWKVTKQTKEGEKCNY